MGKINVFHMVVIIIGIGMFLLLFPGKEATLSFYGFAESNETEINYNYPVVVEAIHVSPGQRVSQGDTLLELSRRKTKENLADQEFRIKEIKAEQVLWASKQRAEIEAIQLESDQKITEINYEIEQLRSEIKYKEALAKDLKSVDISDGAYQPLEEEIKALELKKQEISKRAESAILALEKNLRLGGKPFEAKIEELEAELYFDSTHSVQFISVLAPADGLIGNIDCKEEEHIPSYSTLLSFYEPHSGIIKGFVHEDLTLKVNIGDPYMVTSLKDEGIEYPGKVVGLGSRIVEIPSRLRKMENIKAYGREVLIAISKENTFLQKEKVSVKAIDRASS